MMKALVTGGTGVLGFADYLRERVCPDGTIVPPAYALLETTGRKSGVPRRSTRRMSATVTTLFG